jgi:hypothetical protein
MKPLLMVVGRAQYLIHNLSQCCNIGIYLPAEVINSDFNSAVFD